jgi:thymidylate synthase (FAD)
VRDPAAMKDYKIDLLDHGFVRLVDSMGDDLSVVRAARVSYDAAWRAGEDQGSDKRLIGYLWKHRHTSPFEAVTFTFEVKAPIFVFRQWHRHGNLVLQRIIGPLSRTARGILRATPRNERGAEQGQQVGA